MKWGGIKGARAIELDLEGAPGKSHTDVVTRVPFGVARGVTGDLRDLACRVLSFRGGHTTPPRPNRPSTIELRPT